MVQPCTAEPTTALRLSLIIYKLPYNRHSNSFRQSLISTYEKLGCVSELAYATGINSDKRRVTCAGWRTLPNIAYNSILEIKVYNIHYSATCLYIYLNIKRHNIPGWSTIHVDLITFCLLSYCRREGLL